MFEWSHIFTSAGLSGALICSILFLSRNWLKERLAKSIQHEYDEKLIEHQASLNKELERVKSDLESNRQKVENVQSGVIGNLTAREGALYSKQIEAVENIWKAKRNLDKGLMCSMMTSSLDWNKIGDNEPPNEALKKFASLFSHDDHNELLSENTNLIRLYVDPMIWAYFSAYQSIILDSIMRMMLLKNGMPVSFIKKDGLSEILKTTLPEFTELIDKHGINCFNNLLGYISEKLLETSQDFLNGHKSDQKTLRRASEIIKLSEELNQKQTPAPPAEFVTSPPSK